MSIIQKQYIVASKTADATFDLEGDYEIAFPEDWGIYAPDQPPPIPKECDCGAHKTYGDSCPISRHSDWCSLVESDDK